MTYPGIQGGTNWYSPSYSQRTGLFYVGAWDNYYSTFTKSSETPLPWRRGAINTWTDDAGHGSIMAIDPATGDKKWEFKMYDVTDSGILTTDGDVLFSGGREGNFYALDARSGAMLWKTSTRRRRGFGSDHLSDRWQAIRRGRCGAWAVCVCGFGESEHPRSGWPANADDRFAS